LSRNLWSAAVLAACLAVAALLVLSPPWLALWQERIFDRLMLTLPPATPAQRVTVIDIGATDDLGQPWDRTATARLVARIVAAKPQATGFDIVFSGACDRPVNAALAHGFAQARSVLGFLLAATPGGALPPDNLAVAEGTALWSAAGAETPCPAFTAAATTVASVALPGDGDAAVRRLPAAVSVDGMAYPSLPVALARLAHDESGPLLTARALRLGKTLLPVSGGMMRFVPSAPDHWIGRTLPAAGVLSGEFRLPEDALILVGSSLPEAGGLRPTAASPVAPSVQIMADMTEQILAGHLPWRPDWGKAAEALVVLVLGLAGLWLLATLPPVGASLILAAGGLLWAGAVMLLWRGSGLLLDPVSPLLAAFGALALALLSRAALASRAERALRARMAQLVPPALVSRIAADPGLMRLEGELREVTALFTDIEGFSIATAEMGPREMVALLDAYFAVTCGIVLKHGGMIDKLVGDSVHALFNAPLDQPGHEAAALACAADLMSATERFRTTHGGFGRTRIGLETGPAVLGDVGHGGRIDYTAHGAAVNLAARLQEANKRFGTACCIGPELARRCPETVRPLGEADIRSFGPLPLYTLRTPASHSPEK
jgi:adenylate cyclase